MSTNGDTINWTPQLHWTIVDLVTSVCVTSLPALSSLLTKHLPQSVRKYWSNRDNVDEFGRPFNDGYFYEANQRSNSHSLRHGGWGELFGKHDLDLEKYVTPDPSTPSRNEYRSRKIMITLRSLSLLDVGSWLISLMLHTAKSLLRRMRAIMDWTPQ